MPKRFGQEQDQPEEPKKADLQAVKESPFSPFVPGTRQIDPREAMLGERVYDASDNTSSLTDAEAFARMHAYLEKMAEDNAPDKLTKVFAFFRGVLNGNNIAHNVQNYFDTIESFEREELEAVLYAALANMVQYIDIITRNSRHGGMGGK